MPIFQSAGIAPGFDDVPTQELERAIHQLGMSPREFCVRQPGQPWQSFASLADLLPRLRGPSELALGITGADYQRGLRIFQVGVSLRRRG